jgi:hypothetical protein
MPGIELDDEVALRVALAAERRHHAAHQRHEPIPHVRQTRRKPHDLIERGRLRQHDIALERAEHLAHDGRAATRHVEDEPGQLQLRLLRLLQLMQRRAVAEQQIERLPHRAVDRLLEERIGYRQIAEMTPLDHRVGAVPPDPRRHPRG